MNFPCVWSQPKWLESYPLGGGGSLHCSVLQGEAQKKIFPTNFYTQKIEKKNFFFRFARVCACCDGVNMRSEMSIFDLKFMCQFLHDFWPENPYMHFRSKILISERKLTPSQHAQTRANRKKNFFFSIFCVKKWVKKFFTPYNTAVYRGPPPPPPPPLPDHVYSAPPLARCLGGGDNKERANAKMFSKKSFKKRKNKKKQKKATQKSEKTKKQKKKDKINKLNKSKPNPYSG